MKNCVDSVIDSAVSTKILERNPVSIFSSCKPPEPLVQFVQHDFWQNSDEKVPASLSTVYSQRVLHSLSEPLKSSGVNMSETKICVQLGLRKRADHEYSITAYASRIIVIALLMKKRILLLKPEASAKN